MGPVKRQEDAVREQLRDAGGKNLPRARGRGSRAIGALPSRIQGGSGMLGRRSLFFLSFFLPAGFCLFVWLSAVAISVCGQYPTDRPCLFLTSRGEEEGERERERERETHSSSSLPQIRMHSARVLYSQEASANLSGPNPASLSLSLPLSSADSDNHDTNQPFNPASRPSPFGAAFCPLQNRHVSDPGLVFLIHWLNRPCTIHPLAMSTTN